MRIISIALSLIVIFGLTGYCAPTLETDNIQIDFGNAPQNSILSHKLVIKSVGDKPAVIAEIDTYCKCITIPLKDSVIAPGDSVILDLFLNTGSFVGVKLWQPHIYLKGGGNTLKFRVKAKVVGDMRKSPYIHVYPHTIIASQFGENTIKEFPINIINNFEDNVPLKLIYTDDEFYTVDFPTYIPPNDTAYGKLVLNQKGLKSEFERTIIFEYIDDKSEKMLYSIPTKRKIYK